MPPSGKIPVSTAALRTVSTTLSISTRASRLAEYSSVKCGIVLLSLEPNRPRLKFYGDVEATEARSLSLWERVGVRGYGLSMGRNPSPGSQERSDLSQRERWQNTHASTLSTTSLKLPVQPCRKDRHRS